jgi:hypothetical protein
MARDDAQGTQECRQTHVLGRPTLQTLRRSPVVYRNLEPSIRAHPSGCPAPRPAFPDAYPVIMEHDFQTRFDGRERSGNFLRIWW